MNKFKYLSNMDGFEYLIDGEHIIFELKDGKIDIILYKNHHMMSIFNYRDHFVIDNNKIIPDKDNKKINKEGLLLRLEKIKKFYKDREVLTQSTPGFIKEIYNWGNNICKSYSERGYRSRLYKEDKEYKLVIEHWNGLLGANYTGSTTVYLTFSFYIKKYNRYHNCNGYNMSEKPNIDFINTVIFNIFKLDREEIENEKVIG